MLKDRIINTLKFFDLQNTPLTLMELHRFLIADMEGLRLRLNSQWEMVSEGKTAPVVGIDRVLECLDKECGDEVSELHGYYCVKGRKDLILRRLANYEFGIKREKLIRRFAGLLAHVPFVRGIALGGSQAFGLPKEGSDIDLLIVTDRNFMFLARAFVTLYFQVLGKRRHGKNIANRFCLNHYLSWPKPITHLKNLYTAMEYGRLRPLVYGSVISDYQKNNAPWINQFFPNWKPVFPHKEKPSSVQGVLEKLLANKFGKWMENAVKSLQLFKIRELKFIVVLEDELSFHPDSKQEYLLSPFFNSVMPASETQAAPAGDIDAVGIAD